MNNPHLEKVSEHIRTLERNRKISLENGCEALANEIQVQINIVSHIQRDLQKIDVRK